MPEKLSFKIYSFAKCPQPRSIGHTYIIPFSFGSRNFPELLHVKVYLSLDIPLKAGD